MKVLPCSLAICLQILAVTCVKNNFNHLVDEVIYEMEQDMLNKSQTVLKLPEISQTFSKKILFFTVDGSLDIKGASVQNLSTIYRIGDVIPREDDSTGTTTIEGTFGMKHLSFSADMFDFKLSFIHMHDPLTVTVGKNAATFNVSLVFDENMNCKSYLNYAKVSQLGDFSISLGSGLLTDIEDELAGFVLNRVAPTVQNAINAHIFPMVNSAIKKLDLCNKLL